jgi:uncharacterized protein (TIGR02265 family)
MRHPCWSTRSGRCCAAPTDVWYGFGLRDRGVALASQVEMSPLGLPPEKTREIPRGGLWSVWRTRSVVQGAVGPQCTHGQSARARGGAGAATPDQALEEFFLVCFVAGLLRRAARRLVTDALVSSRGASLPTQRDVASHVHATGPIRTMHWAKRKSWRQIEAMNARSTSAAVAQPQTYRCFSKVKRIEAEDSWDELRARIGLTPGDAMVRGMFFSELLRSAPGVKVESRRYVPFSLYPVREYMALILQVAAARPEKLSPATQVLRTGCGVYSHFASSLAGTAIFSIARDFKRVVELAPKAYGVTLKPSQIEVAKLADGEALVCLRKVWPFPDIFHAGIWLGAIETFGGEGEIEVTRRSLSDADFLIRWSEGSKNRR